MRVQINLPPRTNLEDPVPLESRLNGDAVEALAKEMGLEFKRTRDPNHPLMTNDAIRDPDIVYLCDPEDPAYTQHHDAIIFWKTRRQSICWDDQTKASIRKILEDDGTDSGCIVCFEDLPIRESLNCTRCNGKICSTCMIKLALTEQGMAQILRGDFDASHRCPECRNVAEYDIRRVYFRILDRMEEFSSDQQRVIRFIMNHDYMFEAQMSLWVDKHPLNYFKPGVITTLGLLKAKKKWNGKRARIIGEPVIKGDRLRWPIQMIGGKREKALLKQSNMSPPSDYKVLY